MDRCKKKGSTREKRFISDLIGLGIQGISALLGHRKQNKLKKSMKHLLMRQQELDNKIVSLENDMMSLNTATLSELDYLRKENQLVCGLNIKQRKLRI